MAEELQGLINKIREEGIKAAENKASEIEKEAKHKAETLIAQASKKASDILDDAREKITRSEDASKESLKQAGRDLMLVLRKEINAMLDKLVAAHVHKVLTSEEMAKILCAILKDFDARSLDTKVIISARKDELDKLEKALLAELKEETKKGIILRSADTIRGGFMISYDSGRSYYDFSDKALAEYIAGYLRPKLGELLKSSI